MRSIKLSELGAQPKYQAFVQRFMRDAHIECGPSECSVDVLDEQGYLLSYHSASGDVRLTSPKVLLREMSDYVCSFDEGKEFEEAGFSAMHNALIETYKNGFAVCDFDGEKMTLCRFKD